MQPGDHHWLEAVETHVLYDNAIQYAIECVLSMYLVKKWDKALRREFGVLEGEMNLLLLLEEGLVNEVKGIMKEIFESVDKLQANLDKANVAKATLKIRVKTIED